MNLWLRLLIKLDNNSSIIVRIWEILLLWKWRIRICWIWKNLQEIWSLWM